jgi:hypothetical protein
MNVEKVLSAVHLSSDIKEFTLENNPEKLLNVTNCKLDLSLCQILECLCGNP